MTGLPSTNSSTVISGNIEFANAQYKTTYTNKTVPQHVIIQKTTQDSTTPLPDAVFDLYTEKGYNANPKTVTKTGLRSGADGKIDLGNLANGKYYLVETAAPAGYILLSEPVEITVSADEVTYNQSDNSRSKSKAGIIHDEVEKTYTLTVTNNAGYELPSTGGPGTRLFTIMGSLLIALAGGIFLWRRRRIS